MDDDLANIKARLREAEGLLRKSRNAVRWVASDRTLETDFPEVLSRIDAFLAGRTEGGPCKGCGMHTLGVSSPGFRECDKCFKERCGGDR